MLIRYSIFIQSSEFAVKKFEGILAGSNVSPRKLRKYFKFKFAVLNEQRRNPFTLLDSAIR
jgi:hypothetical protein